MSSRFAVGLLGDTPSHMYSRVLILSFSQLSIRTLEYLGITRPMRNYHLFLNAAFILGYGPYCSHMTICFRTNQVFPHSCSQLSCYYLYHFFSFWLRVILLCYPFQHSACVLEGFSSRLLIPSPLGPPQYDVSYSTCHDSAHIFGKMDFQMFKIPSETSFNF